MRWTMSIQELQNMDRVTNPASAPRNATNRSSQPVRTDTRKPVGSYRREAYNESQDAFATALQQTRQRAGGVADDAKPEDDRSGSDQSFDAVSSGSADQTQLAKPTLGELTEGSVMPLDASLSLLALQRVQHATAESESLSGEHLADLLEEPDNATLPVPVNTLLQSSRSDDAKQSDAHRIEKSLQQRAEGVAIYSAIAHSTTGVAGQPTAARVADVETLAEFFQRVSHTTVSRQDGWHIRVLNSLHGMECLHIKTLPTGGWHVQVTMQETHLARAKQHLAQLRAGLREHGVEFAEVEVINDQEDEPES